MKDELEKTLDLEINNAHLRGQLAAHKVLLAMMGQLVDNMAIHIDKMLEETRTKQ